jgi:DNA-binding transcriptional MerR regulator
VELLDIGEVAELTGLAPSALRFYERRGLVEPAGRHGLRRVYEPESVARLRLIACARRAGFSVAEIARFLAPDQDEAELRNRLAAKVTRVEEDMANLDRMRRALRHATECRVQPFTDCTEFRAILSDDQPIAAS